MAKHAKKEKWYKKLRNRYRLVVFNDQTFEERFSFRLTRINVLGIVVSLGIIFITLTFFIIAYTPIREYIPGYPSVDQKMELYSLNLMADSMLSDLHRKDMYIQNIKNIIEGKEVGGEYIEPPQSDYNYDTIVMRKSAEDSILRAEFEHQTMYNLYFTETAQQEASVSSIRSFNFFSPIVGIPTSHFDAKEKHFGIDIAASRNEVVKATLDGTVIIADWTLETGHVIAIQHRRNLISVYKHNSVLLKKMGDHANAGEPIAITGQSGELATGPHLHFELWYNGTPVNPEDYVIFN